MEKLGVEGMGGGGGGAAMSDRGGGGGAFYMPQVQQKMSD